MCDDFNYNSFINPAIPYLLEMDMLHSPFTNNTHPVPDA